MISDTHGNRPSLPEGDVLVHCGDLTHFGSFRELREQVGWLQSLDFAHIVFVGGNHDVALGNLAAKGLEDQARKLLFGRIHYLRDSGVTIDGVRFWGSPWIPPYAGEFNLPENELREKFELIPPETDVLVTHGPPAGVRDGGTGSTSLAAAVRRVRPRIHCFGHVHDHRGEATTDETRFFNCAKTHFVCSLARTLSAHG